MESEAKGATLVTRGSTVDRQNRRVHDQEASSRRLSAIARVSGLTVGTAGVLLGLTAISAPLPAAAETVIIPAPPGLSDPGVRAGAGATTSPIVGLTEGQKAFYNAGLEDFVHADGVSEGLGPRFNLDSCAICHSFPAVGGSSPQTNPEISIPARFAGNTLPPFIPANGAGPIVEARFRNDNAVHPLFVISGATDGSTAGCNIQQEDFATQIANNNISYRIPTPVFGEGLLEEITDTTLTNNLAASSSQKAALGIVGHLNHNPNDGTVTRFGWKAQNKSMLVFAGEAYNVEIGISNEMFTQERDETASCQFFTKPNDFFDTAATTPAEALSGIEKFAFFMRFLAPPPPSSSLPGGSTSINNGKAAFNTVGCALCHTPTLTTGNATVTALANKPVNLYSDLALHAMGPNLADRIVQGQARGDEFRTAPLWGLGQRTYFLHDGRTADLFTAIQLHKSLASGATTASEANAVVDAYNNLSIQSRQDVLNFLRSL